MILHRPLAFVDLETTGLGPGKHRIAEIGVVTPDAEGAPGRWSTLVNPGRLPRGRRALEGVTEEAIAAAPRFAEIATELAQRLAGRLLVAHNARFDYAFLKSEFERAGARFEAPVLCTVMLSRKLYPQFAAHHLDALIGRYGLCADGRHRALPDADLIHQFWQILGHDFPARRLWAAVDKLLAEPVLPPHLDLELVHALPEKPGVYLMRGASGELLRSGRAANLRGEVKDYFRLDRISARAAKVAYKVRNIEWHESQGDVAARLLEIQLAEKEHPARCVTWTIQVDPAARPIAQVVPAAEVVARSLVPFGLFSSARKAANALSRLAERDGLCRPLLGIAPGTCTQPRHLVRAVTTLSALRLQPWPYAGPVGLREGRAVHVFDQWQWLGSARTATEVAELAALRPRGFDPAVFRLLARALPRISARRVKALQRTRPRA